MILVLWEYLTRHSEPVYPIVEDPFYPEVVLARPLPVNPRDADLPRAHPPAAPGWRILHRTRENRPLIGPMGVEGAYLIGALSGFGVMAACASGELLASHVTGSALPNYAPAFTLERYSDPAYLAMLDKLSDSGQL